MALLALELNDAGLVLAGRAEDDSGGRVLIESPGFALLEGDQALTGTEAANRARLRPLFAHNRFWRDLSVEPLPRPGGGMHTTADIAHEHLSRLIEPYRSDADGLLLAVPPGMSRDQLGLLLGVAAEAGLPVLGLVDLALSAAALRPSLPQILHLDLDLHRAVLTALEHSGEGEEAALRRTRFEILPQRGWLMLQQAWVELLAATFVRRTRFDPLHEATTEQRLVDELPGWMRRLSETPETEIAVEFGGKSHSVELTRDAFIAAVDVVYDDLLRLVQTVRPAGQAVTLLISTRVSALPGLGERLTELRDCRVEILPVGAAALGALAHATAIRRPPDALALVYRLPLARAQAEPRTTVLQQSNATTDPAERPSHVLHRGRAWSIDSTPLTLGWSVRPDRRALALPSGMPGVSREHCTLSMINGSVLLEDHSTYGSFVNEERVKGSVTLKVGDRLRLGAPGVTLDLIQLVNDDGTPQD